MCKPSVTIIGGGLAGCEAAYYLASRGIDVTLVEMKPKKFTPAHQSPALAELVCSNSLKSNDSHANACGLLKEEMRILGSLIIEAADATAVPAGAALAVYRELFSAYIEKKLRALPCLTIVNEEVTKLPIPEKDGGRYALYGFGSCALRVIAPQNTRIYLDGEEIAKVKENETDISIHLHGKAVLTLEKE